MGRTFLRFLAATLIGLGGVVGCTPSSILPLDDVNQPGSNTDDPLDGGDPTQDPNPDDGSVDDSVADVAGPSDPGSQDSDQPFPSLTKVAARVRNESEFRADLTLRFISEQTVVHLAFVRVLSGTITTVHSPDQAEVLELSGIDERGRALSSQTFVYGVDFDEKTPAEYIIPGGGSANPLPDDPPVGDLDPPTLTMLWPAEDLELPLGSTLLARWVDQSEASGAVVRIYLRAVNSSTQSPEQSPLGPAVGAALDGLNDELLLVLQDLPSGLYDVLGEIDDGVNVVTSIAPGRVRILEGSGNAAPSLTILAPDVLVELNSGDLLPIAWDDEDKDDNATIVFQLNSADPAGLGVGPFVVSPPLAEDPDGDRADSALFATTDVLPGLYDLVGSIDDGQLVGTARVEGVVRILPEPQNDTPHLELIEPAEGDQVEVGSGGSFLVRWDDSDENDNARISIMLDPDLSSGVLDGDEILLVSSLGEDEDQAGDAILLGVPDGTPAGSYRVAGRISDGVAEVVTWADGIVFFGVSVPGGELLPPELNLLQPFDELWTRSGDSIEMRLHTANIPDGAAVRLYLSNLAYGGSVRVDLTPATLVANQVTTLTLPSYATGVIPNSAWPRSFELQADLVVDGVIEESTVSPGVIWIRQEVEITLGSTVNFACVPGEEPTLGDREFLGIEIEWYGGGYQEREPHAVVEFWIASDGTLAADPVEDRGHRLVHSAAESPNVPRVVELRLWHLMGVTSGWGEELTSAIDVGEYQLLSTVETADFGRITSWPYPDWFELCYQLPPGGISVSP